MALEISRPKETGEVIRFSAEARRGLEREGFLIYTLTGKSLQQLSEEGRDIGILKYLVRLDWKSVASVESEVAINPNNLFLPGSFNRRWEKQQKMVAGFSRKLQKRTSGQVRAIVGNAADYVELYSLHRQTTGVRLFGDRAPYARTATSFMSITNPDVAFSVVAGGFHKEGELYLSIEHRDFGYELIGVAPLVVPF